MDASGGETKCSCEHKAALIWSPHPPQQSLITESWLAGFRMDRQAGRQVVCNKLAANGLATD